MYETEEVWSAFDKLPSFSGVDRTGVPLRSRKERNLEATVDELQKLCQKLREDNTRLKQAAERDKALPAKDAAVTRSLKATEAQEPTIKYSEKPSIPLFCDTLSGLRQHDIVECLNDLEL